MDRRQFLATLAGLPVVLKALSEGDYAQAALTPEGRLEGWEITFPDGIRYRFQGIVTELSDTLLRVQPVGQIEIVTDEIKEEPSPLAQPTLIHRNGMTVGELKDISLPSAPPSIMDGHDYEPILGLPKRGSVTFNINFQTDTEHA